MVDHTIFLAICNGCRDSEQRVELINAYFFAIDASFAPDSLLSSSCIERLGRLLSISLLLQMRCRGTRCATWRRLNLPVLALLFESDDPWIMHDDVKPRRFPLFCKWTKDELFETFAIVSIRTTELRGRLFTHSAYLGASMVTWAVRKPPCFSMCTFTSPELNQQRSRLLRGDAAIKATDKEFCFDRDELERYVTSHKWVREHRKQQGGSSDYDSIGQLTGKVVGSHVSS